MDKNNDAPTKSNFARKKDKAIKALKAQARKIEKKIIKGVGKKAIASLVASIGVPGLCILALVIFIPIIIGTIFTPDAKEETIKKYAQVAAELQIDWKELVAFDMARYGNKNLDDKDPNNAASYFLIITEEKYEMQSECVATESGPCTEKVEKRVVTQTNTYEGGKRVREFLGETDLKKSLDAKNSEEGTNVTFSSHGIKKAMELAGFTEEQKTIAQAILDGKMLEAMYPDISSSMPGGSVITGICTGPISPNGTAVNVTAEVQSYDGLMKEIAAKYDMTPYIEIMKAQMNHESKGQGKDPMQASEGAYGDLSPACRGKKGAARMGCITDPRISIEAGIQEFRDKINAAGGDIALALQTYNFGGQYLNFAKSRGGHSVEVAKEFSIMKANEAPSVYNCRGNKNDWRYPACYGDFDYVNRVLKFYQDPGCIPAGQGGTGSSGQSKLPSSKGWMWPTDSTRITGTFYEVRGNGPHNAVDIGGLTPGVAGDPIYAMEKGTVQKAGFVTRGGYGIYIDHGNGIVSRYIHMDRLDVKTGQTVEKGQVIGTMGGTDYKNGVLIKNGYAVHLDFQIRINNKPVDPMQYFQK